jgi:hypothetical protein
VLIGYSKNLSMLPLNTNLQVALNSRPSFSIPGTLSKTPCIWSSISATERPLIQAGVMPIGKNIGRSPVSDGGSASTSDAKNSSENASADPFTNGIGCILTHFNSPSFFPSTSSITSGGQSETVTSWNAAFASKSLPDTIKDRSAIIVLIGRLTGSILARRDFSSVISLSNSAVLSVASCAFWLAIAVCVFASSAFASATLTFARESSFCRSAITQTCVSPRFSEASPMHNIIQQAPAIISNLNSWFLNHFLNSTFATISTPSPATPIKTAQNPIAAITSQKLSDDESHAFIHEYYIRHAKRNLIGATMSGVLVLASAALFLVCIFSKLWHFEVRERS